MLVPVESRIILVKGDITRQRMSASVYPANSPCWRAAGWNGAIPRLGSRSCWPLAGTLRNRRLHHIC